jgi:hypothetical protein
MLRARESGVYGISREPLSRGLRKGDQSPRGLTKFRFYLERVYNVYDT